MASDQYPFIGALDLDTPVQVFKKGFLNDARNVIARGVPGDMRYENMPGTRPLGLPLPSGTNGSVGSKYDTRNHRVFAFNWNSNGNHVIYIIDTLTEVIQTLIANTLLGFDPAFPISSIDILYGDSTQGDVLYWVNSQGVPSQININQALAGDYGTYRSSYLQVIKEPASIPPKVVYEPDLTATVNNLRKQLFVFKTEWIFNDQDKSVWSAWSEVPLPIDASDTAVDADPTKNSVIALVIQTGPPNVKKLRIAVAITKSTQFGDFLEIDLLDKADLGIPDDDIYIYYFKNDKAYIPIDIPESILEFDHVPLKAGAGILLNGNTPAYGNITEGFDLLTSLGASNVTSGLETERRTQPKALFVVSQSGDSIGTAGTNIHTIVAGTVATSDSFSIFTTNFTINYIAIGGDTPTLVIAGLAAAAIVAGFTVVSSDANNLVIRRASQQLVRYLLSPFNIVLGVNDTTFVYDWWGRYAFCLTYFDAEGRTNGAQITSGFTVTTSGYAESSGTPQIPTINLSIYHQPPVWAAYFHIDRTKNLSESRVEYWISDRTFKDNVASLDGNLYAYISIESLNQYIKDNPSSSFLAYDFAPGDRIRFVKSYPSGGTTTQVIQVNKDFEIRAQLINPSINGQQQQGQFLKILLPATDATFDFGIQFHSPFTTDIDYSNYFIRLYTPNTSAVEGLDFYYEFGERYAIGNPYTTARYHQGMLQNQSTNYVTPATFLFTQGDYYLRTRKINVSPEFIWSTIETDIRFVDCIGLTLDSGFFTPDYEAKSVPPGPSQGDDPLNSSSWMLQINDGQAHTFNLKTDFVIESLNNTNTVDGIQLTLFIEKPDVDVIAITLKQFLPPIVVGTKYEFVVDTQFTVPATYTKVFMLINVGDSEWVGHLEPGGTVRITDDSRVFDQLVIDPNFSDSFQSAVNSNGRPWTFDINAKQVRFPVLMRYGQNYEVDTNINNSNRFYPQNFDTYNNSYGDIIRFYQWEKELTVFQYRKCGVVGVFARWVRQGDSTNLLITSDTIITPNNINYYVGEYGIGNQPLGLACSGYQRYFPDPVKGYLCRLSQDGVTPISDLYKAQSWAGVKLPTYLNPNPYQYGGNAKLLGVFQFNPDRSSDYICYAQGNLYGLYSIGEALAFNEQDNMFRSKIDQAPDGVVCAENKLFSFYAGEMYAHDNTAAYGNFYGQHYDATVQFPMREPVSANKSYMALSYAAPYPQYNIDVQKWLAPTMGNISTAEGQISNLVDEDFDYQNGMYHGAFQRNDDSDGGVNDGDQLQGLWLQLRLSNASTQLTWLSNLYLNYQASNRNF